MVEAAGIEAASESTMAENSTGIAPICVSPGFTPGAGFGQAGPVTFPEEQSLSGMFWLDVSASRPSRAETY